MSDSFQDDIFVSHGTTTHSLRDSTKCPSCVESLNEFDEAMKNGSLEMVLENMDDFIDDLRSKPL